MRERERENRNETLYYSYVALADWGTGTKEHCNRFHLLNVSPVYTCNHTHVLALLSARDTVNSPSIAHPGATTCQLCNNPKKSSPVASVLVRNIVARLRRRAISHQSPLGPVKLEVCRQATTRDSALAVMLLTGDPLCGRSPGLTGMLLAADAENVLLSRLYRKIRGYSQPRLFRGSADAWAALPQRLAG